jgi:hypothetical protein
LRETSEDLYFDKKGMKELSNLEWLQIRLLLLIEEKIFMELQGLLIKASEAFQQGTELRNLQIRC